MLHSMKKQVFFLGVLLSTMTFIPTVFERVTLDVCLKITQMIRSVVAQMTVLVVTLYMFVFVRFDFCQVFHHGVGMVQDVLEMNTIFALGEFFF